MFNNSVEDQYAKIQKEVYNNQQKIITSAKINIGSTAEKVAIDLYSEIIKYQKSLPETEDVVIMLVQFGQTITLRVTGIGYSGYTLVCFHGEDTFGKPLELIQHVQQLNFLLTVEQKEILDAPKRQIGFEVN